MNKNPFQPKLRDRLWLYSVATFKNKEELGHDLRGAVLSGNLWRVCYLLDECAVDVNTDDGFALRWAANSGKSEMVSLLLARGADVHAHDDEALFRAVGKNHVEVVSLLLDAGASVSALHGRALLLAHQRGNPRMIATLLQSSEDLLPLVGMLKKQAFAEKNLQLEMIYMGYLHKRTAPKPPAPPKP